MLYDQKSIRQSTVRLCKLQKHQSSTSCPTEIVLTLSHIKNCVRRTTIYFPHFFHCLEKSHDKITQSHSTPQRNSACCSHLKSNTIHLVILFADVKSVFTRYRHLHISWPQILGIFVACAQCSQTLDEEQITIITIR